MNLGNVFADVAAGVRIDDAAAAPDIVNRIGYADAVAYKIIRRLVAVGCVCAALKSRRPAAVARKSRPDLAALVASSRHSFQAEGRGFRCSTCNIR